MIEVVSESNIEELLPLIRDYQKFYEVEAISDSRNKEFFSQFGPENPFGCQFLYRSNGIAVGFATVFLTYSSTITSKVGVMNDLFVSPDIRGNGVGRVLIEKCHEYATLNGACRLQWVTAPDNYTAQKLYDSLDTNERLWKFYTYKK